MGTAELRECQDDAARDERCHAHPLRLAMFTGQVVKNAATATTWPGLSPERRGASESADDEQINGWHERAETSSGAKHRPAPNLAVWAQPDPPAREHLSGRHRFQAGLPPGGLEYHYRMGLAQETLMANEL